MSLNEKKNTTNDETSSSQITGRKNVENEDGFNAFRRQSRVLRSPIRTPVHHADNRNLEDLGATPVTVTHDNEEDRGPIRGSEPTRIPLGSRPLSPAVNGKELTPTIPLGTNQENEMERQVGSPNQEFIARMRKEEETAISNIKRSLVKMRAALQRQRNISNDVREGIQQIEELVCIAETCRVNWIKTEREKKMRETGANGKTLSEGKETPKTNNTKRPASSPIEASSTQKKQCDKDHVEWRMVENKRKPPRKETRPENMPNKGQQERKGSSGKEKTKENETSKIPRRKTKAIVAKPREGYSYSDVLKKLRERTEIGGNSKVKTIRKTGTGSLILELEKGEQINPVLLLNIKETLKGTAEIKSLTPKATIEARDLDALTTSEEVEKSIRSMIQTQSEPIDIRITRPNTRELVRAFITVSQEIAEELLKIGYVKVGWCRGRLRRYEDIRRCFRCFGIGHEQWNCKGPDRKSQGICIRCGKNGHLMKTCRNEPKCCICTEAGHKQTDHVAGSMKSCIAQEGPK